jgi:hypothetical protein
MKSLNDFKTFLRAETGLYYFKKYAPFFDFTTLDSILNYTAAKFEERDTRCMEYLWSVFQEGTMDVNQALKVWNDRNKSELVCDKLEINKKLD